MQVSANYVGLLSKLESLGGAVIGKPGFWTWFYDPVGVCTVGYGHVLHHPDGLPGNISRAKYPTTCAQLADRAMVKYYGTKNITHEQVLDLRTKDMQNYADAAIPHIRADTSQCQFDMLVDFAYNVGEHALETSTLLRMHNEQGRIGTPLNPITLAANSKRHAPIQSIADGFCAWSGSGGKPWTLGVFHRRLCEALIYAGSDYDTAYLKAWSFQG